jgi:hypothetical protein
MNERPILFLDIDGVLNDNDTLPNPNHPLCESYMKSMSWVCPKRIEQLNKICEQVPDLYVVLSSSWRVMGIEVVQSILKDSGYIGNIHNETVMQFSFVPRDYEIMLWLDNHLGTECIHGGTNFVILDDAIIENVNLKPHHVQTSMEIGGFSDEHVNTAISILNGE